MMLMHAEVTIHNTKVVYNVCTVKSFLEVISHSIYQFRSVDKVFNKIFFVTSSC